MRENAELQGQRWHFLLRYKVLHQTDLQIDVLHVWYAEGHVEEGEHEVNDLGHATAEELGGQEVGGVEQIDDAHDHGEIGSLSSSSVLPSHFPTSWQEVEQGVDECEGDGHHSDQPQSDKSLLSRRQMRERTLSVSIASEKCLAAEE